MPANVETAGYSNTPAWHREGVVIDTEGEKGMTIVQAVPATGLDWSVEKLPALGMTRDGYKKQGKLLVPKAGITPVVVPGRFNVVRNTDGAMLGNVGKTWQPVQPAKGFQLVDDLIAQASNDEGRAWIESGGSLDGGKKIWILVHLETGFQIAGEQYMEYLLFTNGFDGRASVAAATTNVRVVCQNTLALAMDNNPRVVRVRHTTKAAERIKEASQILALRNQYNEQLAHEGEWLAETAISDDEFDGFLKTLMPIKDGQEDAPAGTMIRDRRDDIRSLYAGADNITPIRGTRWGALQSVLEYADHGRKFADTGSQMKNQFGIVGSGTTLKDQAMVLLREPSMKLVDTSAA